LHNTTSDPTLYQIKRKAFTSMHHKSGENPVPACLARRPCLPDPARLPGPTCLPGPRLPARPVLPAWLSSVRLALPARLTPAPGAWPCLLPLPILSVRPLPGSCLLALPGPFHLLGLCLPASPVLPAWFLPTCPTRHELPYDHTMRRWPVKVLHSR
jgi:hypothetical protein